MLFSLSPRHGPRPSPETSGPPAAQVLGHVSLKGCRCLWYRWRRGAPGSLTVNCRRKVGIYGGSGFGSARRRGESGSWFPAPESRRAGNGTLRSGDGPSVPGCHQKLTGAFSFFVDHVLCSGEGHLHPGLQRLSDLPCNGEHNSLPLQVSSRNEQFCN